MYSTAHLAMGLIIGKISGDYPTAIISSTAIDIDHLIPYVKNKIIFNFKEIWKTANSSEDTSRSILHSFFALVILSSVIFLFNVHVGIVFTIGYLSHFLLDALDDSEFYPFFPIKKFNTKGFIGYRSKMELMITASFFLIWLIV